ncbi:argininosuccinate lyase, partial [bacterium]|nr:argininosuccinate lyase [bacterium]
KVPFREAHHSVGEVVALAEGLGKRLNELTLQELQSVDPRFDEHAMDAFDLNRALARRRLPGSPGPAQVKRRLAYWKKALG